MSSILASVGDTVRAFAQAAGQFFDSVGNLDPLALLLGLGFFALYLLLRSRAIYSAVVAAYPGSGLQWRRVWGAYVAAYGINGFVPAGAGNIVQIVLVKSSIEDSNYATVTAALASGAVFDSVVAAAILIFAFSNSEFPRLKSFGGLQSFDISFFARHPQFTIFLVTASIVLVIGGFGVLSRRIADLRTNVRRGWVILGDRRRYLLRMVVPQSLGWVCRGTAYFELLRAFHLVATFENAVFVLAVVVIAAIVPFTPGGAGVQQALLLVIFGSSAPTNTVAAFSVGQQIAIVMLNVLTGLAAVIFIFKFRSFRDVIRYAKASRAAERAGARSAS